MNAGVLICPGGGYEQLSPREAEPVAAAFEARGFKTAILRYSVADIDSPALGAVPLREAAKATARLRESLGEGARVALCGFSAGGHLAASLGVHWNNPALFADMIGSPAHRPDALVLCYPVITAGKFAHKGSMERLAGEGDEVFFSLELHVGAQTPPAFLWHTADDESVPVENSLLFASALSKNKVPFELHVYPHGPHGLSLATKDVEDPAKNRMADPYVAAWFPRCCEWLKRTLG